MSKRSYVSACLCLLLWLTLTASAKAARAPQKASTSKTSAKATIKSHAAKSSSTKKTQKAPLKSKGAKSAVQLSTKKASANAKASQTANAKKSSLKPPATKALHASTSAKGSTKSNSTLVAMKTSTNSNATRTLAKPKATEAVAHKKPIAKLSQTQPKRTEKSATPSSNTSNAIALFAVSQNQKGAFLDPIVVLQDGRFVSPPTGDGTIAQATKFANAYYREGQKYRLLFGGGEAGNVVVKQWNLRKACSRTQATAELDSAEAKINGKVMGLATNSKLLGKKACSRRFPTEKEKAAIYALAETLYKQKGVTEAELKDLQRVNITATDLNGDGKAEIIGTFMVKRPTGARVAHILFLIAEPSGKAYKTGVSQYGQITAKDVGGTDKLDELGDSALAEILVDQIDLDKDGTAEVIIADTTAEGVAYKIFKKQKNQWRKAYEFYNLRCAN
jgi:hypothetical protein